MKKNRDSAVFMQVKTVRILIIMLLAAVMAFSCLGCKATKTSERTADEIISDMIISYGYYQDEAEDVVKGFLEELEAVDKDKAETWTEIMYLWKDTNENLVINYDRLDEGLPEDDSMCMVVLGFALNADGSMKEELIKRLNTALDCAKQYPNAYVLCTGGGTAANNDKVTEAGQMAAWLKQNGLAEDRLIVEDESLTTGQNAIYSQKILSEQYPQVDSVAVVSSDYHIKWGYLLFEAQFIIARAEEKIAETHVVSNASCKIMDVDMDTICIYQAGGLLELAGQKDMAYKLYYEDYNPPTLEDLRKQLGL